MPLTYALFSHPDRANTTHGLHPSLQLMLDGCQEFAKPYIDDVVIFSRPGQEYLLQIDEVLEVLGRAGLTANPQKCEWGEE